MPILKVLLSELKKLKPPPTAPLHGVWLGRWQGMSPTLVEALNRLTGRDSGDAAAWLARQGQKACDLEGLLAGTSPLAPVKPSKGSPWSRMRSGFPTPKHHAFYRRLAVEAALQWLASHQSSNGSWEAAGLRMEQARVRCCAQAR